MTPTRRFLLRGLFQGSAAIVALPFLDCFLDSKGQALAATGRAIPTRFGTFFWGCGLTKALYLPKSTGANYEDMPQLASLKPHKSKINLLSGFRAYIDDKPNIQHWTGNAAITTGIAPAEDFKFDTKTIDQTIGTVSGKARASARSKFPAAATSARAIPAWAAATSIRRRPRRWAFTPACSAPDSRIPPKQTGNPIRK